MIEDRKIGWIVMLIAISSVMTGVMQCLSVATIGEIIAYKYESSLYFFAYVSGSIGFLLTAPVNIILPILRKHAGNIIGTATTWSIVTVVIFLLACVVGMLLMLSNKWIYGTTNPVNMAVQFVSGSFLLLISGGIFWLFKRRVRK